MNPLSYLSVSRQPLRSYLPMSRPPRVRDVCLRDGDTGAMTRTRARRIAVTLGVAASFVLSACGQVTDGAVTASPSEVASYHADTTSATPAATPATPTSAPFTAARKPGLQPDAPAVTITMSTVPTPGTIDYVSAMAVSDAVEMWGELGLPLTGIKGAGFSLGDTPPACAREEDAGTFCRTSKYVVWSRDELGGWARTGGDLVPAFVMAHEVGHAAQVAYGVKSEGDVRERGADCLSGVYARWVMEDSSDRFAADEPSLTRAWTTFMDAVNRPTAVETAKVRAERTHAFNAGFDGNPNVCWNYTP